MNARSTFKVTGRKGEREYGEENRNFSLIRRKKEKQWAGVGEALVGSKKERKNTVG